MELQDLISPCKADLLFLHEVDHLIQLEAIKAKTAGKGIVEYKEIARALGQEGAVTKDRSENLILMAGYRSRLVPFYHDISDGELYTILNNNLSDVEAFVKEIKRFIESYKSQQDQPEK